MASGAGGTNWVYATLGLALVAATGAGFGWLNYRAADQALAAVRAATLAQEAAEDARRVPEEALQAIREWESEWERLMVQAVEEAVLATAERAEERQTEWEQVMTEAIDDALRTAQEQASEWRGQWEKKMEQALRRAPRVGSDPAGGRESVIEQVLEESVRAAEQEEAEQVADEMEARINATEVAIHATLSGALELYRVHVGHYPTRHEGALRALLEQPADEESAELWRGPYVESAKLLRDAWGNSLFYENPGTYNTSGYDLFSAGPDGEYDSPDDIVNWERP